MAQSATKLREHLYETLDGVLETGVPAVITRKGRRLLIVAEDPPPRVARLSPHPGAIPGDAGELVLLSWSGERGGRLP